MTEAFRPTAAERAIGRELERWRRSRDLSLVELGRLVGCSNAKLSKVENALWPVSPGDVTAIGMACRIEADERNALFDLATWARRQRTAGPDTVIFDVARDYIQLESEASKLRVFTIDVIYGLFQTADYTRASAKAYDPVRGEVIALQQIKLRAERRQLLTARNPAVVEAVFPEAVLRIMTGGPRVMKDQLHYLLKLADLPNVQIQVIPFNAGAYSAPGSPFEWLSFSHELHDDLVYTETIAKGHYMEVPEDRERYTLRFAGLQEVALDPAASLELIAEVADRL